jgi:hypothetical protein
MIVVVTRQGDEVEVVVYSGSTEVKRLRGRRLCRDDWLQNDVGDDGCLDAANLPDLLIVEATEVSATGDEISINVFLFERVNGFLIKEGEE